MAKDQSELPLLDMPAVYKALGSKIEAIRTALQLKQHDICQRTGFGSTTMSAIENGRQTVSLDQLGRLALALNVPADVLIKGIWK